MKGPYQYPFPMVSATATVIPVLKDEYYPHMNTQIVLGLRGESSEVYRYHWCLPGGFLEAKTNIYAGECLEQTAVRELEEELNLKVDSKRLTLFKVISDPTIDPRAHVINVVYILELDSSELASIKAGDDLMHHSLYYYSDIDSLQIAFNHRDIINDYMRTL